MIAKPSSSGLPGVGSRRRHSPDRRLTTVKILVPVKRVPDAETTIKIAPDGKGIVEAGVKWSW
jgi:hypothetical protein